MHPLSPRDHLAKRGNPCGAIKELCSQNLSSKTHLMVTDAYAFCLFSIFPEASPWGSPSGAKVIREEQSNYKDLIHIILQFL